MHLKNRHSLEARWCTDQMSMRIQMWESFKNYIISYLKDTLKKNSSLTLYR